MDVDKFSIPMFENNQREVILINRMGVSTFIFYYGNWTRSYNIIFFKFSL